MSIDNSDVKLVIQWDILLLFDLMIQHMGWAGRKIGASMFVLFTPEWTRFKDPDEIEKRNAGFLSLIAVNAQLSNNNRPKALPKISHLSQVLDVKDKLNDSELVASELVAKSEGEFEIN